jgi:glutathione S-transferase
MTANRPSGRHVTLFHSPNTRSTAVLILLEELRAEYTLRVLDMKASEQRQPAYLAINPMGKVPALLHGDSLVTELVAIFIYLADLYPEASLAPALTDPRRGPYLRWLVFYGSCFEPAVMDRSMKRDPGPAASSPYGDFDTVLRTVLAPIERGPYLLGESCSAADVLWGTALGWMVQFGIVASTPGLARYVERINARPALARVRARDEELEKAQALSRAGAAARTG